MQSIKREPGYYWLQGVDHRSPPFIAQWTGEHWQFIGTPYIAADDHDDMQNYTILGRVADRQIAEIPRLK